MKIIHLITAFGIGGAEKLLLNIVNKQVNDHEVYVYYFKNKFDLVPFLDKRVHVKQYPFSLSFIIKLKKDVTNLKPEIIHTHLGHADLIGLWIVRNLNVKIFTTIHSTNFKNNWKDTIFFMLYRSLKSKIKNKWQVISISKSVENVVIKKIRIEKENSHVLYNAIPNCLFDEKVTKNTNCVKILFVGRLAEAKSVETLLLAIKLLSLKKINKKFHLDIVGDGVLRKKLETQVEELNIKEFVTFQGEQLNVDEFFAKANIFILPSIWEGFGIVILEAFRSKTTVIASNIEGPSELIKHEINGLLFEPKNYIELSEKILELIFDKDKTVNLALNGYVTFSEKYTIDFYVNQLNKIYNCD